MKPRLRDDHAQAVVLRATARRRCSPCRRSPRSCPRRTRGRSCATPRNTPGVTLETSSRLSSRRWYSTLCACDHGATTSESTAQITATGSANCSTGFTHAADRQPRGEPHRHLAIAVAARQRQQHRDEYADAQQHRQVGEHAERDEAEDRFGQHLSARRLAQQQDQQPREDDRQQHADHRDRDQAEFADEAALEDQVRAPPSRG